MPNLWEWRGKVAEVVPGDWRKTDEGTGHLERGAYLLKTGLWSDVTFRVGQGKTMKEFMAHKFVLRTGSKVFDDLFNEDKSKTSFDVVDLKPKDFAHLLEFLYAGHTPEQIELALPLIHAASKYEVSNLVRICGKLLGETLSQESALKILEQALKYGDSGLAKKALECICKFGNEVIKSPEFLEISTETLANILKEDDLQIPNEAVLFEAVIKWARAECKRQEMLETHKYLRSVLEKVIPFIRFPQMDPTDFGLKVVPTNILLTEEVMSVLVYFSVRQSRKNAVPTGVFNSKPRIDYVPKGEEHILRRLIETTDNVVMDLSTGQSTGQFYIPELSALMEHSIKFKTSEPIWITSIGMNKASTQVSGSWNSSVEINIQLKDNNKEVLATQDKSVTISQEMELLHVHFAKSVLLRPDEWYILSFTNKTPSSSVIYYASNYTAENGVGTSLDFKLPNGSEGIIKFEFRNDDNPKYTGVNQGFIPEIGFKTE